MFFDPVLQKGGGNLLATKMGGLRWQAARGGQTCRHDDKSRVRPGGLGRDQMGARVVTPMAPTPFVRHPAF